MKHPKIKRVYADIAKMEAQEDGTLKVWGYASTGAEDLDGEVILPEAMKAALPDYMKWGAVREMHGNSAAGTAIEAEVQDDGKTWFGAHVVDPVAVKKVETGVYKGFSIGGKVTERDTMKKSTIKGINLIEVSLVDRPCNPEAVFVLNKAARTQEDDVEELAELLDAGTVTPAQLLALAKSAGTTGTTDDQQVVPVVTPLKGGGDTQELPADDAAKNAAPSEPAAPATEVQKGMYTVSDLGAMLSQLAWMCEDSIWEQQVEGDDSAIPASLQDWLKTGIGIFQAMAKEELDELMGRVTALTEPAKAAKAAAAGELAKAGAKFSKDTKAKLGALHDAVKTANDHLNNLGYQDDDSDAGKAAGVPADTNGISNDDAIAKAVASAVAPLNDDLAKARKEAEDLKTELEKLKAQPAPGRAFLKAVTIQKAQDTATAPDDTVTKTESVPPEGTPERAAYEMAKALRSPTPFTDRRLVG